MSAAFAPLGVCPQFGRCGGCSALDLAPAAYLEGKREAVRRAFGERGLAPEVAPVVASPLAGRRRATFTAVREGGRLLFGFAAARSHAVVDAPGCAVLAPGLAAVLPALRDLAGQAGSARARVTATLCANGVDVAVAREGKGRGRTPFLSADDGRIVRVTLDGDIAFQREPPVVMFDGVSVMLPPGAFLQATGEGEAALTRLVLEGTVGAGAVADLFAGLGTFALPLTRTARVSAVEMEGAALEALKAAHGRAAGRKALTTVRRNLQQHALSAEELRPFDAVVFDPPRAGAEGVARALAASAVPRVVAVSCAPRTLARDCAILVAGGYKITQVTPVDQFVGTAHIETVATLWRDG